MDRSVQSVRVWRPSDTLDINDEVEVREWARRLCVTPGELREMVEELGDRSARIATELGVPIRALTCAGGPTTH